MSHSMDALSRSSAINIQARNIYTGSQYGISRIDNSMLVLTTSENFRLTRIGLMNMIKESGMRPDQEILCKRFYADRETRISRIRGSRYTIDYFEILVVTYAQSHVPSP